LLTIGQTKPAAREPALTAPARLNSNALLNFRLDLRRFAINHAPSLPVLFAFPHAIDDPTVIAVFEHPRISGCA